MGICARSAKKVQMLDEVRAVANNSGSSTSYWSYYVFMDCAFMTWQSEQPGVQNYKEIKCSTWSPSCGTAISLPPVFSLYRQLLSQLVCIKMDMFEPEGSGGMLSLEEYFKSFLDTEVKPIWPRGWMQARYVKKIQDKF